jgi:hypothetical protein
VVVMMDASNEIIYKHVYMYGKKPVPESVVTTNPRNLVSQRYLSIYIRRENAMRGGNEVLYVYLKFLLSSCRY